MKKHYPGNHVVTRDTLAAIRARHPLALQALEYRPGRFEIGHGMRGFVVSGMKLSPQQAEDLFRNDILYVESRIRAWLDRPVSDPAYQALVSFIFDVGTEFDVIKDALAFMHEGDEQGFFRWVPPHAALSRFGEHIGRAARFWEAKQVVALS